MLVLQLFHCPFDTYKKAVALAYGKNRRVPLKAGMSVVIIVADDVQL